MKDKIFNIDSDKKIFKMSYYTKVTVTECLFGDVSKDDYNIAYELLKSIDKVDIDCSQKVVQNILLTGGLASLPNFTKRLVLHSFPNKYY